MWSIHSYMFGKIWVETFWKIKSSLWYACNLNIVIIQNWKQHTLTNYEGYIFDKCFDLWFGISEARGTAAIMSTGQSLSCLFIHWM
jgi:hypothetical protein